MLLLLKAAKSHCILLSSENTFVDNVSTKCGCMFLSRMDTTRPPHANGQAVINYAVCDLDKYGIMTLTSLPANFSVYETWTHDKQSAAKRETELKMNENETMSWLIFFFVYSGEKRNGEKLYYLLQARESFLIKIFI